MGYAKRTCHLCGMVKPITVMHQVTIQKQVGHTKDQLTAGTWAGALLFENKASKRRINRRLFANNKRGHFRNVEKWECACGTCHMSAADSAVAIDAAIEREKIEQAKFDRVFGKIMSWSAVIVAGGLIYLLAF